MDASPHVVPNPPTPRRGWSRYEPRCLLYALITEGGEVFFSEKHASGGKVEEPRGFLFVVDKRSLW